MSDLYIVVSVLAFSSARFWEIPSGAVGVLKISRETDSYCFFFIIPT